MFGLFKSYCIYFYHFILYLFLRMFFRKMILTGLLVFIPGSSRAAVAILVSVLSVASLNYVKPHKNYLVFWTAQGSFLITTFKYLSVMHHLEMNIKVRFPL